MGEQDIRSQVNAQFANEELMCIFKKIFLFVFLSYCVSFDTTNIKYFKQLTNKNEFVIDI